MSRTQYPYPTRGRGSVHGWEGTGVREGNLGVWNMGEGKVLWGWGGCFCGWRGRQVSVARRESRGRVGGDLDKSSGEC